MGLWNCGIEELFIWGSEEDSLSQDGKLNDNLPISSFGNNRNNFFLAPRNHAALLKAGAELRPDGKSCFYQLS